MEGGGGGAKHRRAPKWEGHLQCYVIMDLDYYSC